MTDIVTVLQQSQQYFTQHGVDSPRLDAELLLATVLNMERMQLYMHFDRPMSEIELSKMREFVRRRGQREPLAWIIGESGFYEHEFIVHNGVLCPRSDTESLVAATLEMIPKGEELFIADIGCGTGCIGLSILLAREQCKLFAVDKSPQAIDCTKENVSRHNLTGRVAVLKGNLLDPIPEERPIDIILSNPPYIPSADIDSLQQEVSNHEPRLALDGGADGLELYRMLIPEAARRAKRAVLMEIGFDQADSVSKIMNSAGLTEIEVRQDLGGRDRVVIGRRQ